MELSRRELHLLLPLLAAAQGQAEDHPVSLDSKIYRPDQSTDLHGQPKKGGRIFFGTEHSGFALEMHQTVLGPGTASHPPHKHAHDEIMIVLDGTLETYVEGKTEIAEKGAIIFYASNQMHRARNPGTVPARYYVLELRGHTS
jgi:quercetin dioxygenase-like cupin family protein